MKHTGIALAAALLLTACGQTSSKVPDGASDTTAEAAEAEVSAPEATTPATAEMPEGSTASEESPKTDLGPGYSGKVFTIQDAMNTEVMGLKIGMAPDEVISILQGKGFAPYNQVQPEQLLPTMADSGFNCAHKDNIKYKYTCAPGAMQTGNLLWARPNPDNPLKVETVVVNFYLDANLTPHAYDIIYRQNNRDYEMLSPKALDAMQERFGEPSYADKSESTDGAVTGTLRYYLQVPVPAGYTPTKTDSRDNSEKITNLRPIVQSRLACLNAQYVQKLDALPDGCEAVMSGDAEAQRQFDALSSGDFGGASNRFLEIQAFRTDLQVDLAMLMFPLAEKIAMEEANVKQQIADREARNSKEYDAPSDL